MGRILECKCVNCSYKASNIMLGLGMIRGYFYFPSCNLNNGTVSHVDVNKCIEIGVLRNFRIKNIEVAKLMAKGETPYFEKSMFKRKIFNGRIISVFPHLQSKNNYCPKCKKYKLRFVDNGGLFD
jgi:hypothetical protein